MRKQSPEIEGPSQGNPEAAEAELLVTGPGQDFPSDISLLSPQMARGDMGEWYGRKVWESHRGRDRECVLVE